MGFDYKNKTALITGSSSGIGYAFAIELAKRGSRVVLVARSKDKLEALAAMLQQNYQTDVQVIEQDLSIKGAAKIVFDKVQETNTDIHLLVNNAGFGTYGRFEDERYETQHAMTMLNVTAVTDLTHLFLPAMLSRAEGGIINVSSIISFSPFAYMSEYAATKAYILNFSLGLWAEYQKRGIHVLALCPGNTATNFFSSMDKSKLPEEFQDDGDTENMAKPEDVVVQGLFALERNRPYILPSYRLKLLARIAQLVPKELTLWIMSRFHPLSE